MFFRVDRKDFQNSFSFVARSCGPKNSSNPILSAVKISIHSDYRITLSATDMTSGAMTTCGGGDGKDRKMAPGACVIQRDILQKILSESTSSNVTIESTDQGVIVATEEHGDHDIRGRYDLPTESVESFPEIVDPSGEPHLIDAEELRNAIRGVSWCVGDDSSKLILSSIYWSVVDDQLKLLATSGHSFARCVKGMSNRGHSLSMLLPSNLMPAISKLAYQQKNVEFGVSNNSAWFRSGPSLVYGRQVDGTFPPVEGKILGLIESAKHFIDFQFDSFSAAFRQAMAVVDDVERRIEIEFGDKITIRSDGSPRGQSKVVVPGKWRHDPFKIKVDPANLSPMLKSLSCEKLRCSVIPSSKLSASGCTLSQLFFSSEDGWIGVVFPIDR